MKTFVLTTASALLLTSGGIVCAAHANSDTTPVSEKNISMNYQEYQTDAENIDGLLEYDTLDEVVDADDFSAQIMENNNHKRVILLTGDNGQPQFKSIYVKDTNRLKVIDFKDGLVFNKILSDKEEDVEESDQDTEATEQETELEGLVEYSTLANHVDVNGYNAEVVQNNPHKRVIVLKGDHGQQQFKSIYVKDTSRLKIINFHEGLVYNGILE
ncbi:hypothetical protein [Halobacillus hunanensis]|uniref:hypothetical protein n=1 Tax=Halobacillus hunanensis TaxID=578214 RepID=UPI0009A73650|nr:hypothetical protein [Halobacillus hunanensis]